MKLTFNKLNERLQSIFGNEENYEGFQNLRYDLNHNNEMFDNEGNVITKKEANDRVRNYVFNILNIDEHSSKRDRKRAMKKYGDELFAVIEEEIDIKVETGFQESEFFNKFVEMRNLKRGDRQEFWTNEDVVLSVVKVAGDHHDFNCSRVRIA